MKKKIKSLSERHSPPSRKTLITKAYPTPTVITQVQIIKADK